MRQAARAHRREEDGSVGCGPCKAERSVPSGGRRHAVHSFAMGPGSESCASPAFPFAKPLEAPSFTAAPSTWWAEPSAAGPALSASGPLEDAPAESMLLAAPRRSSVLKASRH